jgi:SAM-dependent methyltransferase
MKLASKVGKCARSIRYHGFVATTRSYWNRLRERMQERRLGIRSGEIISLMELDLEHEERREYSPTLFHDFRSMEQCMRPKTPDEVFVDYGAGLGRMLILAATLPFRRVIGVEISPLLAERARENISRCRRKLRCKDIEVYIADAATFEVPTDVTTIYFNNPFAGNILANVLDKIHLSYRKQARRMRLICYLPTQSAFSDQICQSDGFELQHDVQLGEGRRCLVFLVTSRNECEAGGRGSFGTTKLHGQVRAHNV